MLAAAARASASTGDVCKCMALQHVQVLHSRQASAPGRQTCALSWGMAATELAERCLRGAPDGGGVLALPGRSRKLRCSCRGSLLVLLQQLLVRA